MEATDADERRRWTEHQSAYTEDVLREPAGRATIVEAFTAEFEAVPTLDEVIPIRGAIVFDRWLASGREFRIRNEEDGAERQLFDRSILTEAGRSARVRAVIPSWDGRFVAVSASGAGDSAVQVSVIETATGRLLPDLIPDLLTTTSGARYRVAWLPDGSGFIYPRLAEGALVGPAVNRLARGRQYLHRLGTPQSADIPIFGFGVSADIAFADDDLPTAIVMAPNSPWVLASAARVSANTSELWAAKLGDLIAGRPRWQQMAGDAFKQAKLSGNRVYAITNEGANRGQIVSLDLDKPAQTWRAMVRERQGVLQSFVLARDALYFTEYRDGATQLRRARYSDGRVEEVSVPIVGDLRFAPQDPTRDTPWVKAQNWTDPGTWFGVPPNARSAVASKIDSGGKPIDQRMFVTRHIMVEADDGVRVPVSLVHLANLRLDSTAPLLLEAYGGYGKLQAPGYNPSIPTWVRQGGVYAYAHVRGGGELGAAWRHAATRERKVRSGLDFVAVGNALVRLRYTSRGRIVAYGISAGAQMPGLAVAIDPELFGAAIFDVGQPDEIRGAQLDPTAARNLAEMGC
jgi:prolyl oligopeptidase